MSELFTQNYSDKPLFHTDTDISESLHNQVDEASNGEELLDNTEKQAESLLSNDDYVSETKNSISDDRDDVAESLSSPAEGNRKYITGTNTPRASRSNAYYELLCNQQTNGYRSPAMRGTSAAAHGITSASGLVSYQEDFATDAAQDLGVHGAAVELIMQETFLGTAAEDVGILGSYTVKGIKDVQDGTRTAEPASVHIRIFIIEDNIRIGILRKCCLYFIQRCYSFTRGIYNISIDKFKWNMSCITPFGIHF